MVHQMESGERAGDDDDLAEQASSCISRAAGGHVVPASDLGSREEKPVGFVTWQITLQER